MATLIARGRWAVQTVGILLVAAGLVLLVVLRITAPDLERGWTAALILVGSALLAAALVVTFVAPRSTRAAVVVESPLRGGPWLAVNSPGGKVPSHGTHGYGQTWAVDLLLAERPDPEPEPPFADPEAYPSFGRPIVAPIGGTVVRAFDRTRDQRSRIGWGLAWFVLQSMPRELRGIRGVLGNHLVLRLDDGSHLAFAHLKRSSIRPRVGDRVEVGDLLAEVGNTGNSTEPHLHIQRQDVASPLVALGLPWRIRGAAPDGGDGFPVESGSYSAP